MLHYFLSTKLPNLKETEPDLYTENNNENQSLVEP